MLKLAATASLLLLAPFAWVPLILDKVGTLLALELIVLTALYVLAAGLSIASVAGAPFIRYRPIRWLLVTMFAISFAADYVALSIQGEHLSSHMIATLFQARQEIDHALGTYGVRFLIGAALLSLLAPPLLLQPPEGYSLGAKFLAVPCAAVGLAFFLIGNFTGRIEAFPSPIAVPLQAYFALQESAIYLGARDQVVYDGRIDPKVTKIIFVVDESIRADYLQINNPRFDNTPFLASALPMLANFGTATSFSNCSATARLALRAGARDSDFPDPHQRLLRQPTLWQYAKRAGFRTVYMDTWLPVRPMSSMLTYEELKHVDNRTGVSLVPYWEADNRVADLIIEELKRPERTIIFVEKIGLHSPYHRNLPPEPPYVPSPTMVSNRDLTSAQAENVMDYIVGVWWRVDRFFERMLPALQRPDVLMIYTSDHGQALYDAGYEATNCSGQNAAMGEGLVPLLVFAGDPSLREAFRVSAEGSFNRATHGEIFPTLLWGMGFDRARVAPAYGQSLLEPLARRVRRFFVFSPFGDRMQWVTVD